MMNVPFEEKDDNIFLLPHEDEMMDSRAISLESTYYPSENDSEGHNIGKTSSESNAFSSQPWKASRSGFLPRGEVEFPISLIGGNIRVPADVVKTKVSCRVPADRWNAKFSGSSVIREGLGVTNASALLSYDIVPGRFQGISRLTMSNDQPSFMAGSRVHTSTAWYGMGIQYSPQSVVKKSRYDFHFQSQQRLEYATLSIRFALPSNSMKINSTLSISNEAYQIEMGLVNAKPRASISLQIPILTNKRFIDLSLRFHKGGIKVSGAISNSLGGLTRWFGVGVCHDFRQGLSCFLTILRGDLVVKIPIIILSSQDPNQYFFSLCLAAISYFIQDCFCRIWMTNSFQQDVNTLNMPRYKLRKDAEKEKSLMERQAFSRLKAEQSHGLIIIKALYYIPLKESWDVTTQLQFWVEKGSLNLPAVSKQYLLGFYSLERKKVISDESVTNIWRTFWNPQNESKLLRTRLNRRLSDSPLLKVHYKFCDVTYQIEIQDQEALCLPSNKARKI
jgi:Domain of unknown function (DUF3395)